VAFSSSEISTVIEERISNYYANINIDETGRVLTIGDGIVRAYGLGSIQAGEMCDFPASGI
jgi:F0F1-type ATP synthase alpha subunit